MLHQLAPQPLPALILLAAWALTPGVCATEPLRAQVEVAPSHLEVFMADILMFMMEKSAPSESIHAAFWHAFCNDAQALFSIETTREQGISYKGKSTDEGYGYRMPIYWVFKLLSEQHGDELVRSQLRAENTIEQPDRVTLRGPEALHPRNPINMTYASN